MKHILAIPTLLLAVMTLAPCSTFAIGATVVEAVVAPDSAAPGVAATMPSNQQQPGQDFMAWLKKQPNQQHQERISRCDYCHSIGANCCFDTDHTLYCGSFPCD